MVPISPIQRTDKSRESDPTIGSYPTRGKTPSLAAAISLLGVLILPAPALAQHGNGGFGAVFNQNAQPPQQYYEPTPPPPYQQQQQYQSYQPQPSQQQQADPYLNTRIPSGSCGRRAPPRQRLPRNRRLRLRPPLPRQRVASSR